MTASFVCTPTSDQSPVPLAGRVDPAVGIGQPPPEIEHGGGSSENARFSEKSTSGTSLANEALTDGSAAGSEMKPAAPINDAALHASGSTRNAANPRAAWHGSEHPAAMDIPRPDLARKRARRRWLTGLAAVAGLAVVTIAVMRLKPAAPHVDRATVWNHTVKRGEMLRRRPSL